MEVVVARNWFGSLYYYPKTFQCRTIKCQDLNDGEATPIDTLESVVQRKIPVGHPSLRKALSHTDFAQVYCTFIRCSSVKHFLEQMDSEYVFYIGKSTNEVNSRFGAYLPGDIHTYAKTVYYLDRDECSSISEKKLIAKCCKKQQCKFNIKSGEEKVCDNYYLITELYRTVVSRNGKYKDRFFHKFRFQPFVEQNKENLISETPIF